MRQALDTINGIKVKLTVSFPGVGRKRLMAHYAGLRVAM